MNPILFSIGDFFIAWYGLLVAAGLFFGTIMAVWLARRSDLDPNVIFDLLLISTISLFIGARLFYIVTVWDEFLKNPLSLIFTRSGFVFLGGLVGSVLGGVIYVKRKGIPIVRMGDICAPCIPLGHALGRIGCHQTGCCHGGIVGPGWGEACAISVPPAIQTLSDGSQQVVGGYAFFEHLDVGLIPFDAATSLPVWPVQLMSAAGNLALAGFLLWLFFRRRWVGQIFFTYFITYSLLRFGLEFFRGDSARGVWEYAGFSMSLSQIIGLLVFLGGLVGYYYGRQVKLPGQDRPFPAAVRISAQREAMEKARAVEEKKKRKKETKGNSAVKKSKIPGAIPHIASESTPGALKLSTPPPSRERVARAHKERGKKAASTAIEKKRRK